MRPTPSRVRVQDWAERLAELIEARRDMPFAWGQQDCCTLAADAVLAMTGEDPMAPYRGTYKNEAEAEAIIGPAGLEAMVATTLESWGAPECPVPFAQRGDWALVTVGNQLVNGIVLGQHIAAPGRNGLAFVPAPLAKRTWSI